MRVALAAFMKFFPLAPSTISQMSDKPSMPHLTASQQVLSSSMARRTMQFFGLSIALGISFAATAASPQKANFVSVHKATREMFLYDGRVLLAKFSIALG